MTRHITFRRVCTILALTLAWCGLWQTISIANVLSGLTVSTLVVASGIGTPGVGSVRFVPLMQLLWKVLVDLVTSTIDVAVEILTPTDRTQEAVIAVELPEESRSHLLLLVVAITLTPGTAVVDADADTGTIYLHLLHVERMDATIEHVHDLARLASEALPTPTEGMPT